MSLGLANGVFDAQKLVSEEKVLARRLRKIKRSQVASEEVTRAQEIVSGE